MGAGLISDGGRLFEEAVALDVSLPLVRPLTPRWEAATLQGCACVCKPNQQKPKQN